MEKDGFDLTSSLKPLLLVPSSQKSQLDKIFASPNGHKKNRFKVVRFSSSQMHLI